MYSRFRTDRITLRQGDKRPLNQKLLLSLIVILLATTILFLSLYLAGRGVKPQVKSLIERYTVIAVSDAIDSVNRLTTGIQSDSAAKLALVRQNIFLIDRLSSLSLSICGEATVPPEALTALYDDVNRYQELLQTVSSSTLETRSTLLNHLLSLQDLLIR
jgi:hypothetical protein